MYLVSIKRAMVGFRCLYNQGNTHGINKLEDKKFTFSTLKKLQISQMSLKTKKKKINVLWRMGKKQEGRPSGSLSSPPRSAGAKVGLQSWLDLGWDEQAFSARAPLSQCVMTTLGKCITLGRRISVAEAIPTAATGTSLMASRQCCLLPPHLWS